MFSSFEICFQVNKDFCAYDGIIVEFLIFWELFKTVFKILNTCNLYYIAVLLSACGGILVAYCLKYTDAIYKSFAQSGAIITKTSFAIAFFSAPFSFLFALGTIDVFLGISNYNHLS